MKTKLFWLAIAGVLLSSVMVWAAPPQDLSLTTVSKNPDGKAFRITKSYLRDGNKYRVEYLSAEGAVNAIAVYRKDKGVVWGIEPDTKTYTEKKMGPMDWDAHLWAIFPDSSLKLKKTGETKCFNYSCDILIEEQGEWANILTVAREINVIVKFELKQNGKLVQINEATELKLEKPAAALFEIPAGYKWRQIIQ